MEDIPVPQDGGHLVTIKDKAGRAGELALGDTAILALAIRT